MRTLNAHCFRPSDGPIGFGKSAARPRAKGRCFYCQKKRHWKRDCFQKKADKGKESNQAARGEHSGLVFTVYETGNTTKHLFDWIIDSGACQNLCSNQGSFIRGNYKEIAPQGIEIADGSRIEAIGRGDISTGQLILSDVLHVPRVGGNLISVGRLIDAGYGVSFESARCTISKERNTSITKRKGNLCYLQAEIRNPMSYLGLATNKSVPQTIEVWHIRLGHRTLDQAAIQYLKPQVSDFNIDSEKEAGSSSKICETCASGRQHKESITGSREKARELLGVVHSDICGPMQVSTLSGERYFITFIDEMSGRIAVTLLKAKCEALGVFQAYKARAEKEAGREIKRFRTYGGGEYVTQAFRSYLGINGISHSLSPPYIPSHNGLAERANRTLMESARCMLHEAGLDKQFWGFAVATAAHIHNRLPSRFHQDGSPLEHWTGKEPTIGYLRIFGSVTYTHIPKEKRGKLDSKSVRCILLGYDEAGSRGLLSIQPSNEANPEFPRCYY